MSRGSGTLWCWTGRSRVDRSSSFARGRRLCPCTLLGAGPRLHFQLSPSFGSLCEDRCPASGKHESQAMDDFGGQSCPCGRDRYCDRLRCATGGHRRGLQGQGTVFGGIRRRTGCGRASVFCPRAGLNTPVHRLRLIPRGPSPFLAANTETVSRNRQALAAGWVTRCRTRGAIRDYRTRPRSGYRASRENTLSAGLGPRGLRRRRACGPERLSLIGRFQPGT